MRRRFKRVVIETSCIYRELIDFAKELRIYFGKHNRGSVKIVKSQHRGISFWLEVYDRHGHLADYVRIAYVDKERLSIQELRKLFWYNYRKLFR